MSIISLLTFASGIFVFLHDSKSYLAVPSPVWFEALVYIFFPTISFLSSSDPHKWAHVMKPFFSPSSATNPPNVPLIAPPSDTKLQPIFKVWFPNYNLRWHWWWAKYAYSSHSPNRLQIFVWFPFLNNSNKTHSKCKHWQFLKKHKLELWVKSQKDTSYPTPLIISLEIVWTVIILLIMRIQWQKDKQGDCHKPTQTLYVWV